MIPERRRPLGFTRAPWGSPSCGCPRFKSSLLPLPLMWLPALALFPALSTVLSYHIKGIKAPRKNLWKKKEKDNYESTSLMSSRRSRCTNIKSIEKVPSPRVFISNLGKTRRFLHEDLRLWAVLSLLGESLFHTKSRF